MHRLRAEALTGVAAAVLFLSAFALPGQPPSPDAPAGELLSFLQERRGRLLTSSVLIAAGGAFYVWFLSLLSAWLPKRDSGARYAVMLAGATGTAILVSAAALLSALVLQSADADEELVRFGFDAYNALVTIAGASFGVSVIAVAASGGLPRRLAQAGALVAPLQFATLAGLTQAGGFFAGGGPMALIAFWALTAWFVAVAVRVARSAPYS